MAVVKGSKVHRYRVVKERPVWWPWAGLILVVAVGLALFLAFRLGVSSGSAGQQRLLDEMTAMRLELGDARQNQNMNRQALERTRLGAQVDHKALDEVRIEVANLKSQMAQLEEENQFYRNLMAPSEKKRGLTFGAVELVNTDDPRRFRFKVVMQQLAINHQLLNGTLHFKLVGRQDGAPTAIHLSEVSDEIESADIRLRFRYFQNVEGLLVLPEGFEPERIELEARSTSPRTTKIEKRFGWLVQEA